jgi:hypothetical protein
LNFRCQRRKDAHLSYRLKLGHVSFQEDSVNGAALERHMISQYLCASLVRDSNAVSRGRFPNLSPLLEPLDT